MKLEKREITLNEKDSLQDALFMQQTLLQAYFCAIEHAFKRETKKELVRLIGETCEDIFFLRELLESTEK